MSTGGWEQHEWSRCIIFETPCITDYSVIIKCAFSSGGAALGEGPGRAWYAADAGHDRPPDLEHLGPIQTELCRVHHHRRRRAKQTARNKGERVG